MVIHKNKRKLTLAFENKIANTKKNKICTVVIATEARTFFSLSLSSIDSMTTPTLYSTCIHFK